VVEERVQERLYPGYCVSVSPNVLRAATTIERARQAGATRIEKRFAESGSDALSDRGIEKMVYWRKPGKTVRE
jgi:hypothetical protein